MKLKELIETLKTFDEDSEVWFDFSYYDSDEGRCKGSFNKFKLIKSNSWNNKPVLTIQKDDTI